MNANQTTLKQAITLKGTGLHTGKKVSLELQPAAAGTGYVFHRSDLDKDIPASAALVVDTSRGTTIKSGDAEVYTVEHVLASLVGMGVDNCRIVLDNEEVPIMDGSAKPYVDAIQEVGIVELDALREVFEIREVIRFTDGNSEIICLPADEYKVSVMVDYGTRVLSSQNAELRNLSEFTSEIAPCRTFSFLHELEYLLDKGLIKGGDIKNAIIYVDNDISEATLTKLKGIFDQPDVEVTPNGILNNLDLHFPNEAARHKLLDVIGDVALAGMPIKGHIIATRPGHQINTGFALELQKHMKEALKDVAPAYDLSQPPLMDVVQIMNMLPHRPPFLLVDKIVELNSDMVVGVKNVTMNEAFFNGHFPGAPVMPGVLQVEAMAQVGGILALSTVPDPENYLTYFLRIDNVRFKNKVVPGDTIVFRLKLTSPIRRGLVQMTGEAFVGKNMVMQADLMAQIKKENRLVTV